MKQCQGLKFSGTTSASKKAALPLKICIILHGLWLRKIMKSKKKKKTAQLVHEDHRVTIHEICEWLNLSYRTVNWILTDSLTEELLPSLFLGFFQLRWVNICNDLKSLTEEIRSSWARSSYMIKPGFMDTTWRPSSIPQSRRAQPTPFSQETRQVKGGVKILTVFSQSKGVVHKFIPEDQTENQQYYSGILQQLRNNFKRKRPEHSKQHRTGKWLLHKGNAPVHTDLSVNNFLAKHSIPLVPHLRTLQVWPPVTSGHFWSSSCTSRGRGSFTGWTFSSHHRRSSPDLPMKTSSSTARSERSGFSTTMWPWRWFKGD